MSETPQERQERRWLGIGLLMWGVAIAAFFLTVLATTTNPTGVLLVLVITALISGLWSLYMLVRFVARLRTPGLGMRVSALLVGAGLFALSAPSFISNYLRSVCGAQGLRSGSTLQLLCGTVHEEIDITGTLPPRLALVFVQHGPPPLDEYAPCLPRVETHIGPYELVKVYHGEQPFRDFKEYAEQHPAESEWEQIGRFMISREIAAYKTFRPDVIVGFQLGDYGIMKDGLWGGDPNRWIGASFAFADTHTSSFAIGGGWDNDFEQMIDADRLAREQLGLSDPPDYERVIRDFMAEQRGK